MQEKGYRDIQEITRQDKEEKFFNENKREIFEVDKERKKQYRKLKYYLTELHKLFIKDSLAKIKEDNGIDFSKLVSLLTSLEDMTNEKEKEKTIKDINLNKMEVAKFFGDKEGKGGVFQKTAKEYYDYLKNRLEDKEKIKGGSEEKKSFVSGAKNILLSQNILLILDKKIKECIIKEKTKKINNNTEEIIDKDYLLKFSYFDIKEAKEKETDIVSYFKGWATYFKNFNDIRGNLYKDNGRKEETEAEESDGVKIRKANAGQITTRIIDDNLETFARNIIFVNKNKARLALKDLSEKDIVNGMSICDAKSYKNCLLQVDINAYNESIGNLNKFFNEKKQGQNKDIKIDYLKPLHKQLLLTDGLTDEYIEEFLTDEDFINGLNIFQKQAKNKVELAKNILSEDFSEEYLNEINMDENQTHYFCNQFFGSWSYFRDLYYKQNDISQKNINDYDKAEFKDKKGIRKESLSLVEIKELLNSKDRNEFKQDLGKGNFQGRNEKEKTCYDEDKSNFEHFILFLKYYFASLIAGREKLTKQENRDLGKMEKNREKLKYKMEEGEKVDDLLLKKFTKDDLEKSIKESITDKEENFAIKLDEFKKSVNEKRKLDREKEFEFKMATNDYCNRISEINRFISLFVVPEGIDGNKFNETINKFKKDNQIVPLYNQIRNFITKRDEETDKIKLNFENQSLLDGWDLFKEADNTCTILKNENNYFLCIFGKNKKLFNNFLDNSQWSKMEYKQMKDASLSIPKCSTQTNEVKDHFATNEKDFFKTEDSKGNKFIRPLKITKEIFELNNFEFHLDYLKEVKQKNDKINILQRIKADSKNNKQVKLFQKNFMN